MVQHLLATGLAPVEHWPSHIRRPKGDADVDTTGLEDTVYLQHHVSHDSSRATSCAREGIERALVNHNVERVVFVLHGRHVHFLHVQACTHQYRPDTLAQSMISASVAPATAAIAICRLQLVES